MSIAPAPAPTRGAEGGEPGRLPRGFEFAWLRSPPPSTSSPASRAFSPPLIAMVAVVGTAFLIVLYVRLVSRPLRRHLRRRRLPLLPSSPPPEYHLYHSPPSNHFLSPYGLDDSAIKSLPVTLYSTAAARKPPSPRDCAVCLLEFEDDDSLRTLPLCSHSFHADCIDTWLRSHANCPLCRAPIFRSSPFVPLRAARIRPSLDDLLLPPLPDPEIVPDLDEAPRGALLSRSYSFGFERSLAADSSTTPWRYRHRPVWSKRWHPATTGAASAARVFSFRSYRRTSPFQRRRGAFMPLSESRAGTRRARSMTSPVALLFFAPRGSSRERSGDPEALVSPERLNRR